MLRKDLTGQVFGTLTVLHFLEKRTGGRAYYWCRCSCGTEKAIAGSQMSNGSIVSCGKGMCRPNAKHGETIGYRKGEKQSAEYRSWRHMKTRCECDTHHSYPEYGGRGIKVCERWQDFANFLADMGECPPDHTLDRLDNDKHYEPGNCRWATATEQQRNKRNANKVIWEGKPQSLWDLAGKHELSHECLRGRLRKGWDIEKALTEPAKVTMWEGQQTTLNELAERYGINLNTLTGRVYMRGWTLEKALTTPVQKQKKKTSV